jgi:hypothetical protein
MAFILFETVCTTINGVGSKATLLPGWDRVEYGLKKAVISPHTWVPVAGAAIISAGDWDEDISDWGKEDTPLFGNVKNARDWSDYLRDTSAATSYGTLLLTPGGEFPNEWFANKGKLAIAQYTTTQLEKILTASIKNAAERERPSKLSNDSFPSGHAWGNFLAVFVLETFIGNDSPVLISIGNNKDEFGIALNYRF